MKTDLTSFWDPYKIPKLEIPMVHYPDSLNPESQNPELSKSWIVIIPNFRNPERQNPEMKNPEKLTNVMLKVLGFRTFRDFILDSLV